MLTHPANTLTGTRHSLWITGPRSSQALKTLISAFKRQSKPFQHFHWRKLNRYLSSLEKARAFAHNLDPARPLIIHRFNPSSFADLWLFYNFILNPCHHQNINLIISSDKTWQELQKFGLSRKDPQMPIPHTWSKIEWMANSYIQLLTPQDAIQFLKQIPELENRKAQDKTERPRFKFEEILDESQKQAAMAGDFTTQVIASAGSGKTKVIIARVEYLLGMGIPAEKILIVTFNKKTKEGLQERLKKEGIPEGVSVYNFHALGRRILSEEKIEMKILHNSAPKIKEILGKLSTKHKFHRFIDAKEAIDAICRIKLNDLLSPEEYEEKASTDFQRTISRTYKLYEDFKKNNNLIDYDDMLFMPIRMLIEYKHTRERWQARYSHILVDEAQDIDRAQLVLMQILASPEDKLFIVGDDDQTIYSWRSADVDRILNLDKEYPLINRISLKYNYRCPSHIVIAAKNLIENNRYRFQKEITPKKNTGGKIEIITYKEIDKTAANIIKILKQEIQNGKRPEDFAIISRTHAELIPLEMDCIKSDVSYYLGRGRKNTFLELPEIKTLQSCLGVINDFPEEIDFETLKALRNNSQVKRPIDIAKGITKLYNKSKTLPVYEVISLIRKNLGLDEYFREQQKQAMENDSLQIENMNKYQLMSLGFGEIREFLGTMNWLKEKMENVYNDKKGICLQTIHASKGSEFPNLFILGMDDEHMPHGFSLKDAKDKHKALEEERRLAYVAVTRATDKLYLCVDSSNPSRFIRELFPQGIQQ